MKKLTAPLWLASLIALAPVLLPAEPLKIELPPETASFKPAAGSEIANAQCLVCHSVEYIVTQPPFPRTFWAASIKKMREKYDAQIPDAQVEPLLDYLVENYGVKTNTSPAGAAPAPANPVTAVAAPELKTREALGFKFGCTLCHGMDKKIVGPALKDIAAKYRSDPTAMAKINEQVRQGGSGKWGPALMPPFPMVADEDVKILGDWILSLK